MRRLFIFISALTLFSLSSLYGQVSILVSENSGCESLNSAAWLNPTEVYDTITSVTWNINGTNQDLKGDSIMLKLNSPGIYSLTAVVNGTTQLVFPDKLRVYPAPSSEFTYSYSSTSPGYSYLFQLENDQENTENSYEWSVNNETPVTTRELLYTFENTGSHSVRLTARDPNGCESSSAQDIIIADALQCPNVFTPNLDGFNDYFQVSTDGVTIYSFQVFSRTGIKVFQSESPSISWDGRSLSGVEMQPGVYYYLIEAVNGTDNDKVSGFVHLIR